MLNVLSYTSAFLFELPCITCLYCVIFYLLSRSFDFWFAFRFNCFHTRFYSNMLVYLFFRIIYFALLCQTSKNLFNIHRVLFHEFLFVFLVLLVSNPKYFSLYNFQCTFLSSLFRLVVELKRVELLTSCLQGRRSSQLSYSPIKK